jgi:hypothetical protein
MFLKEKDESEWNCGINTGIITKSAADEMFKIITE